VEDGAFIWTSTPTVSGFFTRVLKRAIHGKDMVLFVWYGNLIDNAPTLVLVNGKSVGLGNLDYAPAIAHGLDYPIYCVVLGKTPHVPVMFLVLESFQDSLDTYV
jgi:hypothetical protein